MNRGFSDHLAVYGLAWYRLPSGLWAPADRRPRGRVHLALDGDTAGQGPIAVLNRLPDSFDQFGVFVDERHLGLPVSDLAGLEFVVRCLGFESAALVVAKLGIWIDDLSFDKAAQLEFASQVFSDRAAAKIAEFLDPHDRAVVLAEQHLIALARLLVLHAEPKTLGDLDQRESILLERVLLGMSALSERGAERSVQDEANLSDWLPFLIQNGAFNAKEPLLEAFGRVTALVELAADPESRTRKDFCDLNAWALNKTAISIKQQMAAAAAVLGSAEALRDGAPEAQTALLAPDYFAVLANHLGLDAGASEKLHEMFSAPREWFAAEFERLEWQLDLDASDAAAGYNRTPFDTRPFLRLDDGRYMLWAPRALVSWMTDGFYYRSLDAARDCGRRDQFHTFWGHLVERYSADVLAAVHPHPRPLGSGRLHRETVYGVRKHRKKSPDIALDFGQDLVFIEVFSGRLSLEARVGGRPEKISRDITKMIAGKGQQIGRRIHDYLRGEFSVPGVDPNLVRRVWPVVVTGPSLVMTEVLWDSVTDEIGPALEHPLIRPLTVLDLADLEQLTGLVEAGWSVPDSLSARLAPTYVSTGAAWSRKTRLCPRAAQSTSSNAGTAHGARWCPTSDGTQMSCTTGCRTPREIQLRLRSVCGHLDRSSLALSRERDARSAPDFETEPSP